MEPRASCALQPHDCATRGILVSRYVRTRLHCTLSFSCNPYNYPSPLFSLRSGFTQLPWRVISYVHCIMASKTRIHAINEQPWARMSWAKSCLLPFRLIQPTSPRCISIRKTPQQFPCQNPTLLSLIKYLSPWQVNFVGNAPSIICATVQERNWPNNSRARKWKWHKHCQLASKFLPYNGSRRHLFHSQ